MSVPDILRPHLDGEQIAARVPLGGEDALFVTPTRTLIYRADGLLSDESVEEYPHDAERVGVAEGRRKTKIELDYGIEGERTFAVPTKRADDALHPVLAGVLNGAGVTEPGETIKETYRFSELTLVITSARIVKHIGTAVWDREFEEYHYAEIRGIEVEEGSVSSQIVVDVDGRPQRVKAQNEIARDIFERTKRALLAYHDVTSYAEFEALFADDEDDAEPTGSDVAFGDSTSNHWADSDGVRPIEVNLPEQESDEATPAEATPAEATAADRPATDPATGGSTEPASRTGVAAEETHGRAEESQSEPRSEPAGSTERIAEPSPAGGFEESAFETATSTLEDERDERIAELARAVKEQGELLAEQQRLVERLVDELSRDR